MKLPTFRMVKKLLLLVSILLVAYFLPLRTHNTPSAAPSPSPSPDVKAVDINVNDVPEMKDLLSDNQTTRLNAGRRLAERVGVEEALEVLEHSPLPHTGEGHLVMHQIGFYAYQKYGIDAILRCKDYFLFACYHGVIIEAAADQGIDVIKQMTDKCKESSVRYFQCVHAAGHSILALFSYDLSHGLKTCDELYEKETLFPEALSSCHNGAFMENLFGVHDWGKDTKPKRDWLKDDDPYFPCNAFGEKYQKGCWLNQAARIYQMNQGDIPKTAQDCERIPNPEHRAWCFDNLARQIHPVTNGDITKVFTLCEQVGTFWRDGCIIVNAGAYYSVGGRDQGINVCKELSEPARTVCFQNLTGQIISDVIPLEEKKTFCGKLDEHLQTNCFSRLIN